MFLKKSEESKADIVKQPANFINKIKRYVKKKNNNLEKEHPAFSQFHLKKPDSFVGDSCQKLGSTKDVLIHRNRNTTVSDFLESVFFQLIQRKYILNKWKKIDDST